MGLGPSYNQEVLDLDLGSTRERAVKISKLTKKQVDAVEPLYRNFLSIQLQRPEYYLIPTPFIDAFWTSHISDFGQYIADTTRVFGSPFSHYTSNPVYMTREAERNEHRQRFIELYREKFGQDIEQIEREIKDLDSATDAEVRQYVADMQSKFANLDPNSPPSLRHLTAPNKIKPY